jgi:hypothetical protein
MTASANSIVWSTDEPTHLTTLPDYHTTGAYGSNRIGTLMAVRWTASIGCSYFDGAAACRTQADGGG